MADPFVGPEDPDARDRPQTGSEVRGEAVLVGDDRIPSDAVQLVTRRPEGDRSDDVG